VTEPAAKAITPIYRQPIWLFALVASAIVIGFHVYFWHHAGGFWRDEINLLNLAGQPELSALKNDSFPMLLPLLVRGWLKIAGADQSLRCLGLLIGLGIPATLWLLARRARQRPPAISLALVGLNSTLIMFGDSLRAYGLGCLLILLTLWAAVEFLKRPSWSQTAFLTGLATLSVQTLYHNAVLVGAICCGMWAVCCRRKDFSATLKIFLAGAAAAASLLPYLPGLVAGQQSAEVIRTGLKSWRFLAAFHDALGFPLAQYYYVWLALAVLLVVLALNSFRKRPKEISCQISECEWQLFAGATVLVATVSYVLFLRRAAFPSQSWYLLPLLVLAAGCFEMGLPPVIGKKKRAIYFGLLVATVALAVPAAKRDLQNRFTNIDAWTKTLKPVVAPDDYIIVVPWFCGITFDHYFRGATPWTTVPPLADHTLHRYDLVRAQIQNTNALQSVLQNIRAALQRGQRVWILASPGLIAIPEPGTPALPDLPPAPLEKTGWSEAPYTVVWDSQIAHLLANNAAQFLRVPDPADQIPCIEKMELFLAAGWKNPAPVQK
jgi:Dolichyl-phosphate-mannose-protein mannosyltransferase